MLVEADVDAGLDAVAPRRPVLVRTQLHGSGGGHDEPVEQRRRAGAAEVEQLEPQLVLARSQVLGEVVGLQAVLVDLGVGIEAALAADLDAVDEHPRGPVGADQDLGLACVGRQRKRVEKATTELLTLPPAARRNSGRA